MSWCRFSSIVYKNNRSSDLYIYDNDSGVSVNVASKKFLNEENAPRVPSWIEFFKHNDINDDNKWNVWWEDFSKCSRIRKEWIEENSELIDIGLPYDGQTFEFDNKEDLIAMLDDLKNAGYNFADEMFELAEDWEEDE